MKLTKSKTANENYLAKVVTITNLRKHSNADRLQITTIDGCNVVVGLDTSLGDKMVYFPVECSIAEWFLSKNNLFRVSGSKENLNEDKESPGGFFEHYGRVRAMLLRGERSEGFVIPIEALGEGAEEFIGVEFDTIDGKLICSKYIPRTSRGKSGGSRIDNRKREKRYDRLKLNQFRYHIDTSHFTKNMHMFHPTDLISVTSKLHGTSAIFCNVLCNKELKWWEKLLIKLGVDVKTDYYSNLYSSRKVIKNKYINNSANLGYYQEDVWEKHNNILKDYIPSGITLYGEIVGYVDESKMVQKGFDYGCTPGESEFYLYRVTYTNVDGKVFEYSARQVQQYGKKYGVKVVPEMFYGSYGDFIGEELTKDYYRITDDGDYELLNIKIADYLRDKYLEGIDPMCKIEAPFEGIVIRKEVLDIESYKFKSFRFLKKESEMLDRGEVDMETAESEEV